MMSIHQNKARIYFKSFKVSYRVYLRNASGDKLIVNFPNTAVLYLRHNKKTPDQMRIEIRVPGATCSYLVPVMKVQNYSIEEIFEKNLLFLIPFHIFSYEQYFREYETNEQKLQELTKVYEEIVERLNEYAKEHIIDEYTMVTIIDMSKKVLEHLAKKYSNIKEGVGAVMGGKILDYPAKDLFNAGRADYLTNLVKKKLEKNLSVDEIAEVLEEDVEVIKELIEKLQKD